MDLNGMSTIQRAMVVVNERVGLEKRPRNAQITRSALRYKEN